MSKKQEQTFNVQVGQLWRATPHCVRSEIGVISTSDITKILRVKSNELLFIVKLNNEEIGDIGIITSPRVKFHLTLMNSSMLVWISELHFKRRCFRLVSP